MLFTIGKTEWYEQWLKEQGDSFRKRGKDESYVGGSAYICLGQAIKNCRPGYSVYVLDTTIENLYQIGSNYYILENCRIVKSVF